MDTVLVSESMPDIARPDAGLALVSEWTVGTPERQRAAADALTAAWDRTPFPTGLLSVNLFGSTDGAVVLDYAQWVSGDAYAEFVLVQRDALAREIDRAVPGIRRAPARFYKLYRSRVRDTAAEPGCVVAVTVEFDAPDEARQRRWVDTVFEALDAEAELPPGGISAHFHLGTDGRHVLNYAEWTSEEAHRAALERSGRGTVGKGPKFREVTEFPGIVAREFRRYSLLRSFHAGGSR